MKWPFILFELVATDCQRQPGTSGFARAVSSASQYVNDAMRELLDLIRDGT
jgi:hypothetical protein